MDSYNTYRDRERDVPGRSPVREWDSRDDRKPERSGDSFFRGRSPGYDRNRRGRSRSPPSVDRYEPRARGRDDYVAPRDRDERPRRVTSPPANIDRYVPGQTSAEPPAPTVNPLTDPSKLPFQVGFSYFGEWWRANEKIKEEKERARTGRRRDSERPRGRETQEDRDKEKARIQAAYDSYREDLQAKMARTFVSEHKKEQWFRERYVPEVRDAFRAQVNEFRLNGEQDIESGTFDDFSLEGLPKSETSGGLAEKEEGEATASNEVLGVGDLAPANGNDIRDENLYQPTLLIKTIAPHVSRQNLEAFCRENLGEEEGGFKWLSLSDPNPSKRYHRMGWVMLHPASDAAAPAERSDPKDEDGDVEIKSPAPPVSTADKALEAVNGKTVKDEVRGDFVCHVGVHNPPSNPRKKALWDLFSAPERIEKDLNLVKRLVNKFEEDFGSDFNATLKIEERTEDLKNAGRLQPAGPVSPSRKPKKERNLDLDMDEGEEGEMEDDEDEGAVDDEIDDEDLLMKKKQLDLMIEYLRRVFNFCFFCVFESDSIHELTRKCPGGHLRRPRSTLSTAAKNVARATVNGEPFPSKKREVKDEEEGEAPEPDRKPRASKSEQQLERAYKWVKTFEDKIMQILEPESVDIRKLGGKSTEDALAEELLKFVKQEDEHKWRCKVPECTKLFKEEHFWKKHVEKRHADWLDQIKHEFNLINAYVLDPAHIAPSRTDANSNGHFPPSNGQTQQGTPRGFNLHNFTMNNVMPPFPGFPGLPGMPPLFTGGHPMQAPGWNAGGDDRGAGPIRRGGGPGGNRFNNRSGPYDRRQQPGRWGQDGQGAGRGRGGAGRWGDGAAGGAAVGPREAVQGRSLKSYEDLDHVAWGAAAS
ncbi:Zinc finger protein [Apiospora phragmitis]|uniref:Zinc finger protein n=1 Tax=Apiospora phragmitis TaxID=2905665 RepID=A0ABR1TTG2_9PEZI